MMLKVGYFLGFLKERVRALVSVELVLRYCALQPGEMCVDSLFVIGYEEMGKESPL